MHRHLPDSGSALDLLEQEDKDLRAVFEQVTMNRGSSVEERAEYGDLAKTVIRHVATRESALADVSAVVAGIPALGQVSARFQQDAKVRRTAIDRVEKMSRGVQGINLNTGQDFDGELMSLMQIIGSEIEWELGDGIPAMRDALEQHGKIDDLKQADKLAKHAPTNLHADGPRWVERAPIVSRLVTWYDHLRDFPRAVRER